MKKKPCNRREFMSASSLGLAAMSAAAAETEPGKRPPARNRRPAYCIDCQSHLFAPELLDLMRKRKQPPYIYRKGDEEFLVVGRWHRRLIAPDDKVKLAAMDEAGITLTALSTNDPGPEQFGKDGPAVARIIHDYLADVVRRHPKRFLALAALPLQDMKAAMKELDRCVTRLGMKGILLYSNNAGKFPDEPEFRPLFRRAEEMGLPILLHPPYPVTYEATSGYNLTGGLGLMFDTTIALTRIILSGLLDQHAKLKLVCPHVGGTLPFLIGRIDHQVRVLRRVAVNIKLAPSDYLRSIYLDAVNALPMVIRFGYDFVGPDRMLYSSDHPWVDPKLIRDNIYSLKLPREHESKIFADNARRLFGL